MEATKNICGVMGESTVNHGTVTRWLRNFARVARTSPIKTNTKKKFSYGLLRMYTSVLADQLKYHIHQLCVDTGYCLEDLS